MSYNSRCNPGWIVYVSLIPNWQVMTILATGDKPHDLRNRQLVLAVCFRGKPQNASSSSLQLNCDKLTLAFNDLSRLPKTFLLWCWDRGALWLTVKAARHKFTYLLTYKHGSRNGLSAMVKLLVRRCDSCRFMSKIVRDKNARELAAWSIQYRPIDIQSVFLYHGEVRSTSNRCES